MKLKILVSSLMTAALSIMLIAPAFAQNVAPGTEQKLQNWMAKDPRLEANPGLMNDPTYLKNHPNFALWLQQHPAAHRQVEGMGAYDNNHQWHNNNWWHQNNPNWVAQNHPEWNTNHPEWGNPGAPGYHENGYHEGYNEGLNEHHDHDWVKNHPEWAEHHPELAKHHEERVEHHEERVEHREAEVHHYEQEHHNPNPH
jgi:hypothetical protein